MRKTTLARVVDGRKRYYTMSISLNLLGEYELDKVYGSMKNKKPTGCIREFFVSFDDALYSLHTTLKSKTAKGYAPLMFC